uniref:hypothetical protein n=1 Tax=Castellaniella defragrans TaxID=75697 RepID=UPI0033410B33
MNFSLYDPVVLVSFLGKEEPPEMVRDTDHYWKLIGQRGVIVKNEALSKMPRHERGERVLVTFDVDLSALDLSCHNEVPNSLWVFVSDLRCVSDREQ